MKRENRRHQRPLLGATLAAAVIAGGGCKDRDEDEPTIPGELEAEEEPAGAPLVESPHETSPRESTDVEISEAIERELAIDHVIDLGPTQQAQQAQQVVVETTDGIVELTGTVDNLLAKERATLIAEHVRGVRAVSNRLELAGGETIDDKTLLEDVRDALISDPAAESYELEVEVKDGVVTLSGTVDSWAERQLSARVARSIRGVREVDNQTTVNAPTERSDAEIRAEIESRLRWDVLVDPRAIDIEVEDGKVTLSGAVGSLAERRRAESDAWTAGVHDVDVEDLHATWTLDDPRLRDVEIPRVSENEIHNAIVDALAYDPRVFSFEIGVEVTGSTVTLSGTVDNLEAKHAAEQVARNTVGVAHVSNDIIVEPKGDPSDSEIEARVETRLLTNAYTSSYQIEVDVVDGFVTLTGTVDSFFEKAEASDVAGKVAGVVDVTNLLQVEHAEVGFFYDPYFYPYHPFVPFAATYAPARTELSDEAIEAQIEYELRWSPFVSEDEVEVEVVEGHAILTGTVDSWYERWAGEKEAFEGGAVRVDNLLNVDL